MRTQIAVFLVASAVALSGCGDKTQRDVIQHLFEPFSLPEDKDARREFLSVVKARAGVHTNSGVVEYRFIPFMIRKDRDDLSDSMCALVHCLLRDPDHGIMSLDEEWYYSTHTWNPLLLRRRVFSLDKKTHVVEEWATETTMAEITANNRIERDR